MPVKNPKIVRVNLNEAINRDFYVAKKTLRKSARSFRGGLLIGKKDGSLLNEKD